MATRESSAREESDEAVEAALPQALPLPIAAALVFVAAGAVLMLEILAVRLLAPYVGLTLETTTSIIGAALAGIALGAAVGGYFADRTDTRLLIVGLLVGGGLLTLLTVPVVHWLGPGARGDGDLAALGITVAALVPAAAVLSAVSPAVAHLQLHDLRASGTIVGQLSAWATAGALIGTFGTGFVIMPLMPAGTAVLLIGAVLLVIGIALGASSPLISPVGVIGVVIVALGLGALSATSDSPCLRESKYHCLSLLEDSKRANSFQLLLDDAYNSYADAEDPTRLHYQYTRWIAEGIDTKYPAGEPLDVVFVGGGALSLPRWLIASRPGSQATVLEVDGDVVDLVDERLDLPQPPELQVSIGDARITMLDVPSDSADVVVGDAYSGYTVPWHLTTTEWAEEVKRVLKPNGIYAINLIDLEPLDFVKAEIATLLDVFDQIQLAGFIYEGGEPAGGNIVLFASDRPMPRLVVSKARQREGVFTLNRPEIESFALGADTLRDDFAPVDQLRTLP